MRTESSSARIKKKKRSSEHSKRHDKGANEGEWKQFVSPDGHPYFYNAETKQSRWELPAETEAPVRSKHRRPKGSSKQVVLEEEVDAVLQEGLSSKKEKKKLPVSVAVDKQEADDRPKPKNAMFQKLQASLGGKFNAMNGPMMGTGRPPPVLNIRRGEDENRGDATESANKMPSLEDQYEDETAGMSAAERLRFLRKKRQENMMTKRDSVVGDDFMAEVANNMKKKEATRKPKSGSDKVLSWKEKEQAEEDRKRQQMQEEMEAKEQEDVRKQCEQQAAVEREQRQEQELADQLVLEQRREQERKQRQVEESRHLQENEEGKQKKGKKEKGGATLADDPIVKSRSEGGADNINYKGDAEPGTQSQLSNSAGQGDSSDMSSPERVTHRRRSRSRGSKHGGSAVSVEEKRVENLGSSEHEHRVTRSDQNAVPDAAAGATQDEKQRARGEKRASKMRDEELAVSPSRSSVTPESPRRKSKSSADDHEEESSTRSASNIKTEEDTRAIEKHLKRERKRVAKLESALAAQNIGSSGDQGDAQHHDNRSGNGGVGNELHADQSSNNNGSSYSGDFMNGQAHPSQTQFSGGMYAPYPYMMMPPPPPPPPMMPYGYYNPYMQQPPSMPIYPQSMVGAPQGYQLMPPTPPPSLNGMGGLSAMVPYGADSALMPYGSMYGQQQPAPELTRCECCRGIGVGLVEKNGVCAHCNRLRLAFIVDAAQMRQRCSVCGGWGFQLLQANGMCEHCTRQTARKSQRKLVTTAVTRRGSSLAAPLAAVPVSAPPRRNSTGKPKNAELDDIDWDKSSSDSDWDD